MHFSRITLSITLLALGMWSTTFASSGWTTISWSTATGWTVTQVPQAIISLSSPTTVYTSIPVVSGKALPQSTLIIQNQDRITLCSSSTGDDGIFSCQIDPPGIRRGENTLSFTIIRPREASIIEYKKITFDGRYPDTILRIYDANKKLIAASGWVVTTNNITLSGSATFSGVTYICNLDGQTYRNCILPMRYNGIQNGSYTFWLQAIYTPPPSPYFSLPLWKRDLKINAASGSIIELFFPSTWDRLSFSWVGETKIQIPDSIPLLYGDWIQVSVPGSSLSKTWIMISGEMIDPTPALVSFIAKISGAWQKDVSSQYISERVIMQKIWPSWPPVSAPIETLISSLPLYQEQSIDMRGIEFGSAPDKAGVYQSELDPEAYYKNGWFRVEWQGGVAFIPPHLKHLLDATVKYPGIVRIY